MNNITENQATEKTGIVHNLNDYVKTSEKNIYTNADNGRALLLKDLCLFRQQVPSLTKDAANPFFNSHYATLKQVTDAIDIGIKGTNLGYYHYVTDTCVTSVLYFTDGVISCEIHSSVDVLEFLKKIDTKNPLQILGSAITYIKRYTLQGLFGISASDEDDDGNAFSADHKPNNYNKPNNNPNYNKSNNPNYNKSNNPNYNKSNNSKNDKIKMMPPHYNMVSFRKSARPSIIRKFRNSLDVDLMMLDPKQVADDFVNAVLQKGFLLSDMVESDIRSEIKKISQQIAHEYNV